MTRVFIFMAAVFLLAHYIIHSPSSVFLLFVLQQKQRCINKPLDFLRGQQQLSPSSCALPRPTQLPAIFFTGLNKEAVLLRGVKMFYDDKDFSLLSL
jgi:hypothetical protein